ncbi:hypothetical protein [Candidatus Poriferisodalis sp.]|uniref:hypothetical protein n=1 Tax=Candidatus Poriferisodalis sp. TaxID=3101277 RepID=UPI003B59994E
MTPEEHELLIRIAAALNVGDVEIPDVTALPSARDLGAGLRVCFTGTATIDGSSVTRELLEEAAALAGLVPVLTVTKKNCDLLVAADPASSSGKATKARNYGIPIMSVAEFLEQLR